MSKQPWYPAERKERRGISQISDTAADIGEQAALALCGQMLDESHYDLLLTETGLVQTPAGTPLCVLLRNRLPQDLLDAVRPIIRKAAHRKVAGGNRGVAAGTGMVQRKKRSGKLSNMKGAPHLRDLSDEDFDRLKAAKDGTLGFNARSVRGGQVYPCRLTHYNGALPRELALMGVLAQAVGQVFKSSIVGHEYGFQIEKAQQTSPVWMLRTSEGITPFTTITCNKSWRTAAHVDKGDLKEGFGVMCCFGDFAGCDLVFPRYRMAVRYREGDILLANVHEVHGNTALLNADGSVPKGLPPERLVCVFYYQEKMEQCELTMEKEHTFINKRERGEAMRKKKVAKKK